MEVIFAPSAADHQSTSSYNQMTNPTTKRINTNYNAKRNFISRPTENLPPMMNNNMFHGGFLSAPPHNSLSFSYPSLSFSYPPPRHQFKQSQPPLLPLPIPQPLQRINSLPSRTRGLSCPPVTNRKTNRPKGNSLTPKKSKTPKNNAKKLQEREQEILLIESTVPLGPDPKDLPKDVSKVLSSSSSTMSGNDVIDLVPMKDFDKFSGSVFTLSPHPSSLPLPKFSVRSKLSCTAEAAGIDAGATDNLRRLLRLR